MTSLSVRTEVAHTCRVLHRLGLIDLMGLVSARRPTDGLIAVSPGWAGGAPPLGRLGPDGVLVVDLDGEVVEGRFAAPPEVQIALQIYRARPDVQAVIYAAPPTTVAFGMVGRPLLPLTHSQAPLAYEGTATFAADGLITTPERGAALAAAMGRHPICHLPGVGVVVTGGTLLEALRNCDTFEYLARLNLIAASLGDDPILVSREQAAAIASQRFSGEKIPSRDPRRLYASYDDPEAPGRPTWDERLPEPRDAVERVRQLVALSCRILDRQSTLVAFMEHVSHRLPGLDDRFAMSPAKNFGQMEPEDIGIVGTEGDCAWLEGPYPPAPFRWYHRDLLAARPDAQAIVHTHEMYGRAYVMSRQPLRPVYRTGALLVDQPLGVFPTPSMVFADADRRGAVEALGQKPMVHILAHGTDFLADSIEEATVAAIHREQLYKMDHLARQLGQPQPLRRGVLDDLRRCAPSPRDWWRAYAADV